MAFIANTAFEARVTNGRFNDLENIAGKFGELDNDTGDFAYLDCSAGILCKRGRLLECEGFGTVANENTWEMVAAESTDDANEQIYACNTYDWQLLDGYAVGHKTLGLGVPANRYSTFTNIVFDGQHRYRFGVGNCSAALTVDQFATIGSNGLLAPAASAPATNGALYFKVVGEGNFVEGTSNSFGYVDVIACTAIA